METLLKVVEVGGSYDRGIVAKRDIDRGEVVFRENPVASMQHHYNRLCCPACHNCMRTVGTLRDRIGPILRQDPDGTSDDVNVNDPDLTFKGTIFETAFPDLAFHPLMDVEYFSKEQLRYEELFRAPEDGEIFCSRKCYETDLIHKNMMHLRRTGLQWDRFERYAVKHHEHMLLALKCLLAPRVNELYALFSPR